ncbi:MAG: HAD family phosphatase [Lachnospiraceae bacterium]|nr:HAD family phosphatase [Lachnospiraceae bacterium]
MIKNIIFDIGNVLVDWRWRECLLERGYSEEMADRLGDATVNTPVWGELDRGVWTEQELMEAFVANDPEIEPIIREAFATRAGMVTIRDYACEWIEELKAKGYGVYYLSNFSSLTRNDCPDSLAFLPLMDGGILSYEEQMIKPEPAIYTLLLERYGLNAGECIFLDDTPVNVEAACRQGIHGIVFVSKEQAVADMEQIISGNMK